MESGRAPCHCCYCKATTQAFFISSKEVKNIYTKSTLHSHRDYLLYLLCFLFFFPVLAGRNKFQISEFHRGDEDFISIYLILLFPDLMSEMLVYKKVTRQGDMGYLGFFSNSKSRTQLKLTLKLTAGINEKRKTSPTG